MLVQEKHFPVYMRRRRDIGEPVLKTPDRFGLAELHLLRAEAFFQLVSSPKDSLHFKIKIRMELFTYILHLAGQTNALLPESCTATRKYLSCS